MLGKENMVWMIVIWKYKENIKKEKIYIFKWSGKIIEPLMLGVL